MRLLIRRALGNASPPQTEPTLPVHLSFPAAPPPPAADTPLISLGLSKRPYNALMRSGIKTVEQLAALTPNDIRSIRNVGSLAVDEIAIKLDAYRQPHVVIGLDEGTSVEIPNGHSTDDRTPLAALGLSRRTFNALMRGGVKTIGALTCLSSDDVLKIRNISTQNLVEINARLATFAAERVLAVTELTLCAGDQPAPEPVDLRLRAIPVARLLLPAHDTAQLEDIGLPTVGQLLEDTAARARQPALYQMARDYAAWWAGQPAGVQAAEATDTAPGPWLWETLRWTVPAEWMAAWLGGLEDRQQSIIRLRFGLDGPARTLDDIGREMNVTRERVRQLEKRALSRLRADYQTDPGRAPRALAALLHHHLTTHDGPLSVTAVVAWWQAHGVVVAGLDPAGLLKLLAEVDDRFAFWPRHAQITLAGALPDIAPPPAPQNNAPPASEASKPYLILRTQAPAPPTAAPPAATVPRRLPAWPELWPDKLRDERTFMAFATSATASLARRPTVEQFLHNLLAWANRKPNKSARYKQNVLDACYVIGLIEPVNYYRQHNQALAASVSAALAEQALRDHCRRSALARLENGRQLLRALDGAPFNAKRLAARLSMTEMAVYNDVTLFRRLGLVIWGLPPRVPPAIATAYLADDAPAVRQETGGRLRACPALLPDRPGTDNSFLESLIYARSLLKTGMTTDDFLRQMITWAGRDYPKSDIYYQNVLDSYYVVGLIPRTHYAADRDALLSCYLPVDESVPTLREHCIRLALERLEKGPLLLEMAERLQSFTRQDIQSALDMTLDDAKRHIRLFTILGVLSKQGLNYRLSSQVSEYKDDEFNVCTIESELANIKEPCPSWDYEDGLETLAFLGGIE